MFWRKIVVTAVAGGLLFFPLIADSSGPPLAIQPVESLRVLVVLATFWNQGPPPFTRTDVSTVFDAQVSPFFLENSYGRASVDATVSDWVELPLSPSCDTIDVLHEARAAVDSFIDFREFQHIIVIASYARSGPRPYCGWSGLASGTITLSTDDGVVTITHAAVHSSAVNLAVIAHELGHNIGLGHANFLNCGPQSWALQGCSVLAYADYYSVMGRSTPARDLNAYHRDLLGWFDTSRPVLTIESSGTFVLTPIESADPGIKALKIPRPNGQPLYVEYRQPIGFDTGMDQGGFSDVFQGVLLHLPRMRGHESLLIDPTPPGEPHRSSLSVGQAFTDPLTKIMMKVLTRTDTSLTLRIIFPPSPCHTQDLNILSSSVQYARYSVSWGVSPALAPKGANRDPESPRQRRGEPGIQR